MIYNLMLGSLLASIILVCVAFNLSDGEAADDGVAFNYRRADLVLRLLVWAFFTFLTFIISGVFWIATTRGMIPS